MVQNNLFKLKRLLSTFQGAYIERENHGACPMYRTHCRQAGDSLDQSSLSLPRIKSTLSLRPNPIQSGAKTLRLICNWADFEPFGAGLFKKIGIMRRKRKDHVGSPLPDSDLNYDFEQSDGLLTEDKDKFRSEFLCQALHPTKASTFHHAERLEILHQ